MTTSLHDAMGGAAVIRHMTEVFLDRAQHDDLLAVMFAGAHEHAAHIAGYFEANFGGSQAYLEERGDLSFVLGRHEGLNITEAQRQRWVELMLDSAHEAGVPTHVIPTFSGYLHQASRRAAQHSHSRP